MSSAKWRPYMSRSQCVNTCLAYLFVWYMKSIPIMSESLYIDNGLTSNRGQTITWINVEKIIWHQVASLQVKCFVGDSQLVRLKRFPVNMKSQYSHNLFHRGRQISLGENFLFETDAWLDDGFHHTQFARDRHGNPLLSSASKVPRFGIEAWVTWSAQGSFRLTKPRVSPEHCGSRPGASDDMLWNTVVIVLNKDAVGNHVSCCRSSALHACPGGVLTLWRLLYMLLRFDPPFSGLWKICRVSTPIF